MSSREYPRPDIAWYARSALSRSRNIPVTMPPCGLFISAMSTSSLVVRPLPGHDVATAMPPRGGEITSIFATARLRLGTDAAPSRRHGGSSSEEPQLDVLSRAASVAGLVRAEGL